MKKYVKGLSIVIPTYNRNAQLFRLLNSILNQDIEKLHEIIIVDNDSNYDIDSFLGISEKIRIIKNSYNIGMASNIASTFFYPSTKWMWLLSDDDVVCGNSISLIWDKIDASNDCCYLKFSTKGTEKTGIERNQKVDNLEQFIDYYYQDKKLRRGNLVFVSNGVFNLEKLSLYLGKANEFSYTYIPHLIPVFFALNDNSPVLFSKESIVKYYNPGKDFWSFKVVGLGLSTISHLPLRLNRDYYKKFLNLTMSVTYRALFLFILEKESKNQNKSFELIYNNIYRYYLRFDQKVACYFYRFSLCFPQFFKVIFKRLKYLKKFWRIFNH